MKTDTIKTTPAVTLDNVQRLYVLHNCEGGYSCLGFDVCEKLTVHLARELAVKGHKIPGPAHVGTLARHEQYRHLCELARQENQRTGWRSSAELTPKLIGLEGRRVEVRHRWPSTKREEMVRFHVGKSTGCIPCHLQIARRGCSGGPAVALGEILSVRVAR